MSREKPKSHVWDAVEQALIERMARGLGCENCGRSASRKNKYGMRHCGMKGCQQSLGTVGHSRVLAEKMRQRKH